MALNPRGEILSYLRIKATVMQIIPEKIYDRFNNK